MNDFLKLLLPFFLTACSQGPMGLQWNGSSGSTGSDGSNNNLSNSYQTQALAILDQNCTSCHQASSGPGDVYDLTDVSHLVTSGLIVPGSPQQSPLFMEVSQGLMPPGGSLAPEDVGILQNWIQGEAAVPTPTPTPNLPGPSPTPGATPTPSVPPSVTPTPVPTPSPSIPSFKTLESTIFQPKCVSCHSGFSSYSGIKADVNTASPKSSLIYTKTSSGQMPPSGSSLTSAQVNSILQWIQGGAPNN